MSSKAFFLSFCFLFYGLILFVFGCNLYVDPFYVTGNSNQFNQKYPGAYERILKRNYLMVHQSKFDSFIMGSSRSGYFQPSHFEMSHLFNFSFSALSQSEYLNLLRIYKKYQGAPKRIFLGIDFFSTTKGYKLNDDLDFVSDFNIFLHNFSLNMNLHNLLGYGRDMYKGTVVEEYYDRHSLIKKQIPHITYFATDLEFIYQFAGVHKFENYEYDNQMLLRLYQFKKEAENAQVIVFIPPPHMDYFQFIAQNAGFASYRRFIRELVDVFGSVIDFSGPNSVTTDRANYFDPCHFNYKISKCIAVKITERQDKSCPSDFGVKVTKENLEAYLDKLEADTAAYLEANGSH